MMVSSVSVVVVVLSSTADLVCTTVNVLAPSDSAEVRVKSSVPDAACAAVSVALPSNVVPDLI